VASATWDVGSCPLSAPAPALCCALPLPAQLCSGITKLLRACASSGMRSAPLRHQTGMVNALTCTLHPTLAHVPAPTFAVLLILYAVLLKFTGLLRSKQESENIFLFMARTGIADGLKGRAAFSAELPMSHSSHSIRRKITCLSIWLKSFFGRKKQEIHNYIFHSKIMLFQCFSDHLGGRYKNVSRASNCGNCFQRLGNSHRRSGLMSGRFYQSSDEFSLFH